MELPSNFRGSIDSGLLGNIRRTTAAPPGFPAAIDQINGY
jgi:hypothetical protein